MQVSWAELLAQIDGCTKCGLCRARTNPAPGEGDLQARIMFVGEGPGAQEDLQGRPFVGPAGQLLDKMLAAIALNREQVYIANIVKCRPPENRVPTPDEAAACLPYLRAQVGLVSPRIIICLGATAARYCLGGEVRITRDRGKWVQRKGVWMMATYHPAALLRAPEKKREAWEDFKSIRERLRAMEMEEEEQDDGKSANAEPGEDT